MYFRSILIYFLHQKVTGMTYVLVLRTLHDLIADRLISW